jgi:enoyl-CoA hydratase/carnithine racemase
MALEGPAGTDAAIEARQLQRDLIELEGAGLDVVEADGAPRALDRPRTGVVRIGVHRRGSLPTEGLDAVDIVLTSEPRAPKPWVSVADVDRALTDFHDRVAQNAVAAAIAAQVLRMTLRLAFDEALALESLGYSMLLASEGFRAWRDATPRRQRAEDAEPRVIIDEAGVRLSIRLNRPARRNAFDARMRDELADALEFALHHPDAPDVALSGEGPAFSAGGDLDEFGTAADVGWAHMIRTLRSPARLAHALGERLTVNLHGACVGAGIEVPAAAGRVVAGPDAFFRLPEVSMGLIPGAGGTVSIPRRIGRHRACYMAISGADIDLATALDWGLVDARAAPA